MSTASNEIDHKLQLERKYKADNQLHCAFVNSEYLVQLPPKATDADRKAIYNLIMTFAFPMNLNPINRAYIEKTLTENEIEALNNSEIKFLQEKINKEVVGGVSLIPIPKTIYQLYFVVYAFSENSELPKFECPDNNVRRESKKSDRKLDYEGLIKIIQDARYQNAWWKVNDTLLSDWKKVSSLEDIYPFIDAQIDRLVSLVSSDEPAIPSAYLEAATPGRKLGLFVRENSKEHEELMQTSKALLHRVAVEEAVESRFYLLYSYTGTQYDLTSSFSPEKPDAKAPDYLFDGLLSNFLYEPQETPFLRLTYKTQKERLYIYSLDKDECRHDTDLAQKPLFFVPPFPRMLTLLLNNWAYNINLPQNFRDLKALKETGFQEKEGISSAEFQTVQNYYKHLQDASDSLSLPPSVTGIIFQYGHDPRLCDFVERNNASKKVASSPRS